MIQPVLNYYMVKMADLQISRNPLSQECIVIFNDVERDHYQDAVVTETARVKKRVLVAKTEQMHYVQEEGLSLLEDTGEIPWTISLSITGLPRVPRMDDQIMLEGIKYTIAEVKPVNRSTPGLVMLKVYPERSSEEDPLAVYSLTVAHDDVLSMVYGGAPTHIAFTSEAIKDESLRLPFTSYFVPPAGWTTLYLFDGSNNFVTYKP